MTPLVDRSPGIGAAAAVSGDPVDAIDTPALVVDADALGRNLRRMADFLAPFPVRLRPHAKTHKSAHLALRQIDLGAVGVCVQKVGEAEALVHAVDAPGVGDVLVTNEILEPAKLDRLMALLKPASASRRIGVVVDSPLGVTRVAEAWRRSGCPPGLEVLVEIDVGQGRCGTAPSAAGGLARHSIDNGLPWAGLQAYHGGAQHRRSVAERQAAVQSAAEAVAAARRSVAERGLTCPRVTGGGTGTLAIDAASGVWDELQAGSYVFMDRDYADNQRTDAEPRFEHALFVKSRVISRNATGSQGHAVIDAGHKSHALDSGPPTVWRRPLVWSNGGDEHGRITAADPEPGGPVASSLPDLGDTVWLVPGHCDPTVNLHDHLVLVAGGLDHGVVEAIWPIHGRGRLR